MNYPATLNVRDALSLYMQQNGFSVDDYDKPTGDITVLGLHFKIPNPRSRQKLIRRHDLHHVATGFDATLTGEAEISAWELSRGLRGVGPYVRLIIASVLTWGWLIAPRRTWRALRIAPGNASLFTEENYDGLLELTVGELRERLALPREGVHVSAQCL